MRSVTRTRKSTRKSRAKQTARNARKSARATSSKSKPVSRQTFGRRTKFRDDIFARSYRRVKGWLTFRRPMLYLTGGLMVVAMIAALFAGGYVRAAIDRFNAGTTAVSDYAGFTVAKLHLSGEKRTSPRTILAAMNIKPGQSIFDADLRKAQAHLVLLPWVASADVARRYPDSISVRIVEKHPFALWQSPKGLVAIERSGAVITPVRFVNFAELPLFVGGKPKGAADLVEAIAGHRAVAARVRAMERVSGRRWNLILDDKVTVKLPDTGWRKQLGLLENLIVVKGVLERDIREIDLRLKDNYFFVLGDQRKIERHVRGNAA